MGKGLPIAEIFLKDEKDEVLLKKFCDMPCEKKHSCLFFCFVGNGACFLTSKKVFSQ
jgi:hypothetical protein